MSSVIQSLRYQAFLHQAGRCWYCNVLMWLSSPSEPTGIRGRLARRLQCTAENLHANPMVARTY